MLSKKAFSAGLLTLVLGLFALIVVSALTPYGSATTPDSLSYLDIAENFKTGHGWVEADLSLEHYAQKTFKIQRLWPPAYPAILSLFVDDHLDVIGASRLSSLLFALTGLLLFLLLNTALKWPVALAGALLISISLPMVLVHTYVWSETLFIPLMILSVLAASCYTRGRESKIRVVWLVVLSAALIALVYTRYIGIVFFVLLPFSGILAKRHRYNAIFVSIASFIYAAAVGFLLFSNVQITGAVSGGPRVTSNTSVCENIVATFDVIKVMLPQNFLVWVVIAIVLLAGGLYFKSHKNQKLREWISSNSASEEQNVRFHSALHAGIGVFVYLVAIVLMRTHSSFDDINTRLIAPAIPLALAFVLLIPAVLQKKGIDLWSGIVAVFIILLFAAQGYVQLNNAIDNWYEVGSPELPAMSEGRSHANFTPHPKDPYAPLMKFILNQMSESGILVVDKPIVWRIRTARQALQIPKRFDTESLVMLSMLPEGSLMLIKDSSFVAFEETVSAYRYLFEATSISDAKLVKLPLRKMK